MNREEIRIFERLRFAALLTFVSGFLDAYTFTTQGQRFAGLQTGNLINMMVHMTRANVWLSLTYLIPVLFFALGMAVNVSLERWVRQKGYPWHFVSSCLITLGVLSVALYAPFVENNAVISGLSFCAAMQLGTFKRVRGQDYANIMMIGNIKRVVEQITIGSLTRDRFMIVKGLHILWVVFTFCLGAFVAACLGRLVGVKALYAVLLPLVMINAYLLAELYERPIILNLTRKG
ncbi:YoaK family protein [Streptococcus sp. zg-JUN1979]|uniref:YoaK family protein n=1 Tax=Streptococcus sp. zg-JUN1979 TaxID=3391450 RepID=UPI0039A783F4